MNKNKRENHFIILAADGTKYECPILLINLALITLCLFVVLSEANPPALILFQSVSLRISVWEVKTPDEIRMARPLCYVLEAQREGVKINDE